MPDSHKNFAYGTVLTAPSPAASGTSIVLNAGQGARFPTVPFNASVWPVGEIPTLANAEVVRVTGISTDTLTIVRVQEGSSARTIVVGDQFAATVTAKALTDIETDISNEISARTVRDDALSQAISVVSNAVSAETSARVAADNVLSNAVSVVSNVLSAALISITAVSNAVSNEASVRTSADNALSNAISVVSHAVSAEVSNRTSADNALSVRVDTVSQAHSTLSNVVSALQSAVSNVSATSVGGGSATGLQAVVDALSNKISTVAGGAASVTSAEYLSTLSVVSHLRSAVSNVSAQSAGGSATGLQAVVDMLSNKISQAGGGAASVTSAEYISTQSIVSHLASIVSLVSTVSGAGTAVGLQSVINALSNRLSALSASDVSVNDRVSVISANVTSVQSTVSHLASIVSLVSTVSGAGTAVGLQSVVNAISNRVSALSASDVSINDRISVVSGNVTSIQSTLSHLASIVSLVSATSAGGGSATGLQAVIDALSNKISSTGAGAASITSAEYVSTLSVISHLRSAVSNVSAQSAGGSATGLQAVVDMLSNKISQAGGGGGSVTSTELSAAVAGTLLSIQNVDASAISAGAPVYAFTSANTFKKADNNAGGAAQRVLGLVADASIAVSAFGKVRTSGVLTLTTAQWDAITGGSTGLTPGSNYYLDATAGLLTTTLPTAAGATAVAVGTALNTTDMLVRGIDVLDWLSDSISVGTATAAALSNAISAVSATLASVQSTVSHLASTVSLVSTVSGGGTAVGLQNVINALSNRISAIPGGGSTNAVSRVSLVQTVSATALTNISGLSVSVSAGGLYEVHGMLLFSTPANVGKFGVTFPALTQGGGLLDGTTSALAGIVVSSFSSYYAGEFGVSHTGTLLLSVVFGAGNHFQRMNALMLVSTTGVVQWQAAASVGTAPVTILPGSFLRAFKLS